MADYKAVAAQAARKYGLDPHVFVRQINAESGFNPNARSPAGAVGIAQIMPGTARSWGVNPNDPVAALDAAARNMARYVKSYGSYKNALVAYNAGPGRVGKPLLPETAAYVQRILGGSNPSAGGVSATQTVRKSSSPATPSVAPDQSAQRAALISQYLSTEHQPGALTGLATGLLGLGQGAGVSPGGPKRVVARQAAVPAPKGFRPGSPVPGLGPHSPTHQTDGLPGYPAYDYMAPAGTAAVAPVTGRIIKLSGHDPRQGPPNGPHGPFGWSVYIKGTDGRIYYLTHMGARNVRVGEMVRAGQQIGAVGNYAKWGGANHIHMGVHG